MFYLQLQILTRTQSGRTADSVAANAHDRLQK